MKRFASLIDALVFTPSRNAKLARIETYLASTPDPDRGYAIAALTGGLSFPGAKAGAVRALATERVDPELFAWSYDFVGDLAETVSLIWGGEAGAGADELELAHVVQQLQAAKRAEVPDLLRGWFDHTNASGRFALIKLITGGLRVGVSARLAKTALARWGNVDLVEIEELWHGLEPPYEPLFAWLEGRAHKPEIDATATFRPLMLANPVEDTRLDALDPSEFAAEWKWDGIRVQLVASGGQRRIFSRTGDDIGGAFPDILEAMDFDAIVDGELLVVVDSEVRPFNDLQQRLNRKTVTRKLLADHPAHVRLYDILVDAGEDVRDRPFAERRQRLEAWYGATMPDRMDLSGLIEFDAWDTLERLRADARSNAIEGLMLKRWDSPYVAGRPKGPWFKWKRDPLLFDAVLMYAQRGHGKRSSFYSDYTFGAWTPAGPDGERQLVPVGKAYFGFTDEELRQLDRWVRANTVNRFGPVREVQKALVLEVAFDSVHASTRHKSGVAMRFPRIHRIRWDKPAEEADAVCTLERLVIG